MDENLKVLKSDQLLVELAKIYIENCGLSLGDRTFAHYFAIPYIEQTYNINMHDAVDLFDAIMDDIDPIHREYDIELIPLDKFDDNKDQFINRYDGLIQYADILNNSAKYYHPTKDKDA